MNDPRTAYRLAGIPERLLRGDGDALAHLERAGLLRSWRVERRIFYAVDIEGTRRLVAFLTEDCCQGQPEICGYGSGGGCRDDHDLSQPGLRDVAECAGDDPELG